MQHAHHKPVLLSIPRWNRHSPAYLLQAARLVRGDELPAIRPQFESGTALARVWVVTPDINPQRVGRLEMQARSHQLLPAHDQEGQRW